MCIILKTIVLRFSFVVFPGPPCSKACDVTLTFRQSGLRPKWAALHTLFRVGRPTLYSDKYCVINLGEIYNKRRRFWSAVIFILQKQKSLLNSHWREWKHRYVHHDFPVLIIVCVRIKKCILVCDL